MRRVLIGLVTAFACFSILVQADARELAPHGVAGTQLQAALSPVTSPKVPPPMGATGLPVPRWVTIKAGRVNVRQGPYLNRDILWTYVKPGTPVEIIAETEGWRQIKDVDGSKGWVMAALLDGRRNVLVTGTLNVPLLSEPREDAETLAYAAPGLVARLVSCEGRWCSVASRGYEGYVERWRLWGVHPDERVN